MKMEDLHRQAESRQPGFMNGTGFFRTQTELQNSPELRFMLESLNGFTHCVLNATAQHTALYAGQPAEQDACPVGFVADPDTFLFQKGSGWVEKGVKLLPKRTITILKLLLICIIPKTIEELK